MSALVRHSLLRAARLAASERSVRTGSDEVSGMTASILSAMVL
jgi:hypothetical protein